ncbi:hypothetical protein ACJDU8_23380 [Clostridium sp. WILCCON 0269]|uniref:Membrane-anchored protein n=1 Tax=Candidatus Clostridium eludens TaxID=3381663 RepID=A0ABW8SR14_9CLOT
MKISMSKTLSNTPEQHALNKVPQVSIMFWIIKLLSTGMGEATSDFLSHLGIHSPPGMTQSAAGPISHMALSFSPFMAVMTVVLIITMILQIKSHRHVPWKYWLNVVSVAVFGTAAADAVHVGFVMSTTIFGAILVIVLIAWYAVEKTLSVHSIYTLRREIFYWATVVSTFMLGTALGDMTAENLNLGNLISGFMFIGLIAVPAVAYKLFGMNEIFCFWFGYIITRPLGASFADWLSYGHDRGLGLGSGPVSLVSTITIIALVVYVSFTHKKEKDTTYNP